ncbi:hypothetical protein AKJ50_01780 [candidate division MSBL1 archaeon SCGC-AAA382A13]|uniref:CobQ/CobB/MinD/ParA nucleotide binding domain-containing protein n=2 Tax=candidate division MSBL1 TaxID=215777 RepID=A0A133VGZ3_9EURY|nr:hypothetical protein AKJ50_01780 [candidate division MSBL1 archaeon SCGC-AAA382A13]KXB05708.1 hypothetical protein AKJ49_00300 [candidate division MSBL1 archaeon SCGC-AAA382A03]
MKIFVSGKGGAGKSTVSALLAKEMARRGKEVLVVDNDESNFGLHTHLGVELPKDFMDFFGGRDDLFDNTDELENGLRLDDVPEKYVSQIDNLKLLAIGKIDEYGEGCACPMNVLSGKFLRNLSLSEDEVLIVDMDAGVEHFGRKVEEGADVILVVVDPTRESIKLSEKIKSFAEQIEVGLFFVLNKVDEESEKIMFESVDGDKIIGSIPEKEEILYSGLKGESLDFRIKSVEKISDFLLDFWENLR